MKRISFSEIPDGRGDPPAGPEYPQPLTNRINGRRKKHHAETAHHSIEGVGGEGETVSEGHFKAGIVKSPAVPLSTGSFHHLRNCIFAHHLAFRPNQVGHAQRW